MAPKKDSHNYESKRKKFVNDLGLLSYDIGESSKTYSGALNHHAKNVSVATRSLTHQIERTKNKLYDRMKLSDAIDSKKMRSAASLEKVIDKGTNQLALVTDRHKKVTAHATEKLSKVVTSSTGNLSRSVDRLTNVINKNLKETSGTRRSKAKENIESTYTVDNRGKLKKVAAKTGRGAATTIIYAAPFVGAAAYYGVKTAGLIGRGIKGTAKAPFKLAGKGMDVGSRVVEPAASMVRGEPTSAFEDWRKLSLSGILGGPMGMAMAGLMASGWNTAKGILGGGGGKRGAFTPFGGRKRATGFVENIGLAFHSALDAYTDDGFPTKSGTRALSVAPDEDFRNIVREQIELQDVSMTGGRGRRPTTERARRAKMLMNRGVPLGESKLIVDGIGQSFEDVMNQQVKVLDSGFGFSEIVGYTFPFFGAGYKSELPSPRKGLFPSMLKTLGLIYVHSRFAAQENNMLLLQIGEMVRRGFGIEGRMRAPRGRSVSEVVGGYIKGKASELLLEQAKMGAFGETFKRFIEKREKGKKGGYDVMAHMDQGQAAPLTEAIEQAKMAKDVFSEVSAEKRRKEFFKNALLILGAITSVGGIGIAAWKNKDAIIDKVKNFNWSDFANDKNLIGGGIGAGIGGAVGGFVSKKLSHLGPLSPLIGMAVGSIIGALAGLFTPKNIGEMVLGAGKAALGSLGDKLSAGFETAKSFSLKDSLEKLFSRKGSSHADSAESRRGTQIATKSGMSWFHPGNIVTSFEGLKKTITNVAATTASQISGRVGSIPGMKGSSFTGFRQEMQRGSGQGMHHATIGLAARIASDVVSAVLDKSAPETSAKIKQFLSEPHQVKKLIDYVSKASNQGKDPKGAWGAAISYMFRLGFINKGVAFKKKGPGKKYGFFGPQKEDLSTIENAEFIFRLAAGGHADDLLTDAHNVSEALDMNLKSKSDVQKWIIKAIENRKDLPGKLRGLGPKVQGMYKEQGAGSATEQLLIPLLAMSGQGMIGKHLPKEVLEKMIDLGYDVEMINDLKGDAKSVYGRVKSGRLPKNTKAIRRLLSRNYITDPVQIAELVSKGIITAEEAESGKVFSAEARSKSNLRLTVEDMMYDVLVKKDIVHGEVGEFRQKGVTGYAGAKIEQWINKRGIFGVIEDINSTLDTSGKFLDRAGEVGVFSASAEVASEQLDRMKEILSTKFKDTEIGAALRIIDTVKGVIGKRRSDQSVPMSPRERNRLGIEGYAEKGITPYGEASQPKMGLMGSIFSFIMRLIRNPFKAIRGLFSGAAGGQLSGGLEGSLENSMNKFSEFMFGETNKKTGAIKQLVQTWIPEGFREVIYEAVNNIKDTVLIEPIKLAESAVKNSKDLVSATLRFQPKEMLIPVANFAGDLTSYLLGSKGPVAIALKTISDSQKYILQKYSGKILPEREAKIFNDVLDRVDDVTELVYNTVRNVILKDNLKAWKMSEGMSPAERAAIFVGRKTEIASEPAQELFRNLRSNAKDIRKSFGRRPGKKLRKDLKKIPGNFLNFVSEIGEHALAGVSIIGKAARGKIPKARFGFFSGKKTGEDGPVWARNNEVIDSPEGFAKKFRSAFSTSSPMPVEVVNSDKRLIHVVMESGKFKFGKAASAATGGFFGTISDMIRVTIRNVTDGITGVFKDIAKGTSGFVSGIATGVGKAVGTALSGLTTVMTEGFKTIGTLLRASIKVTETGLRAVGSIVGNAFRIIAAPFKAIGNFIIKPIQTIGGILGGIAKRMGSAVKTVIQGELVGYGPSGQEIRIRKGPSALYDLVKEFKDQEYNIGEGLFRITKLGFMQLLKQDGEQLKNIRIRVKKKPTIDSKASIKQKLELSGLLGLGEKLLGGLGSAIGGLTGWLSSLFGKGVAGATVGGVGVVGGGLASFMSKLFGRGKKATGGGLFGGIVKAGKGIKGFLGKGGSGILKGGRGLLKGAGKIVAPITLAMAGWDALRGILDPVGAGAEGGGMGSRAAAGIGGLLGMGSKKGGFGSAIMGALTGATMGSLIPGIGTAVGALVGGVGGYIGSEKITQAISGMTGSPIAQKLGELIKSPFEGGLSGGIMGALGGTLIAPGIGTLLGAAVGYAGISNVADKLKTGFSSFFGEIGSFIKNPIDTWMAWGGLFGILGKLGKGLIDLVTWPFKQIGSMFKDLWNNLKSTEIVGKLKGFILDIPEKLKDVWSYLKGADYSEIAHTVWDMIKRMGEALIESTKNAATSAWGWAKDKTGKLLYGSQAESLDERNKRFRASAYEYAKIQQKITDKKTLSAVEVEQLRATEHIYNSDPTFKSDVNRAIAEINSKKNKSNSTPIKVHPGVDVANLNPGMWQNFTMMATEYNQRTGKTIDVNSGYRSYDLQNTLYNNWKAGKSTYPAAAPGHSLHNFGLAIDINKSQANELKRMGLLDKYGLSQPLGNDPIHLQPLGVPKIPDEYALPKTVDFQIEEANSSGSSGIFGSMGAAPGSKLVSQKVHQATLNGAHITRYRKISDGVIEATAEVKTVDKNGQALTIHGVGTASGFSDSLTKNIARARAFADLARQVDDLNTTGSIKNKTVISEVPSTPVIDKGRLAEETVRREINTHAAALSGVEKSLDNVADSQQQAAAAQVVSMQNLQATTISSINSSGQSNNSGHTTDIIADSLFWANFGA